MLLVDNLREIAKNFNNIDFNEIIKCCISIGAIIGLIAGAVIYIKFY